MEIQSSIEYPIATSELESDKYQLSSKMFPFLDDEVYKFIYPFINTDSRIEVIRTKNYIEINKLQNNISVLISLQRVNDIRFINKYFKAINTRIINGGIFLGCGETYEERNSRIKRSNSKKRVVLLYNLHYFMSRVLPKINITKRLYFFITKGNNRVISKAEMLGRVVSCGFDIINVKEINNLLYFISKKIGDPIVDNHPSYGPIIRMKRIGLNGKAIHVYKIRTMHPFSEYLQEYIYKTSNINKGGKFYNDYRITKWGKVLRKLWLDEIPMLYNYFKGDVKLIGIRPLSSQYLSLYPDSYRDRRNRYKPGLIPPYYIDLPNTIEEIVKSEKKYLDLYDQNPYKTDLKYFMLFLYKIICKNVRSC